MLDWVVLYWEGRLEGLNARSLGDVLQQPVSREVREGVIHDSGDQLGELPGYLRPHLPLQYNNVLRSWPGADWLGSHLLYNLLAVIIEKFIDSVR